MARASAKPGEPTPRSGIYKPTTGGRDQIAAVQGKPMPPTAKPGGRWVLVTPAVHKKGK